MRIQQELLKAVAAASTAYRLEQEEAELQEQIRRLRETRKHWQGILKKALSNIRGVSEEEYRDICEDILNVEALDPKAATSSIPFNAIR